MEDGKRKELNRRVDEILYYLWDPIGVNDEPAARSEYAGYVWNVFAKLISNEGNEALTELLLSFEKENMGLPGNVEHAKKISGILIDAMHAVDEGLS